MLFELFAACFKHSCTVFFIVIGLPTGRSLQCSVCWEDFRLDEPVRKLPCEHVYHENCIIPWLELV